jgi:hypothetical protein
MYNSTDLQRHIGKFYGKYSGEVVNNEDEEKRGQITVRIPSIFGTESDSEVTARPCLPYGHFYIPPVGAKVWVEFEAGNLAYPIWVGTWYPVDSPPEEAAVTPPDQRVIHTASGHIIQLGDKAGEEQITIRHQGNSFVSIDKDGSVIIGNHKGSTLILNAKDENVVLIEQHGNTISMTDAGIIVVGKDGGAAVELKGDMARIVAKDIILQGSSVALGAANSPTELEPTLKGNAFKLLWDVFIFHTHATAMGPSGPPVPPAQPLTPQVLSSAVVVK